MRARGRLRRIHVVTDSTASVNPDEGLRVVPLRVDTGRATYDEGEGFGPQDAVAALRRGQRIGTSGPSPAAFERAYEDAAADGATGVVSVHLSGELSGTVHAAALAASRASVPVRVVDSRTVAMGLGFAVSAADRLARTGAGIEEVARGASRTADSSTTVLLVGSLDHLRRGGRIGPAAAALGTVLGVRPVLAVAGGRLEVVARLRGRAAAVEWLVADAVSAAAGWAEPQWAVQAVGADNLAESVAGRLTEAIGVSGILRPVGPVLAAHVGPESVAIVIADSVDGT